MRCAPTDRDARIAGALKVLVLGGAGFVGRHAVHALREAGAVPIVGSRRAARGHVQGADDPLRRTLRFEALGTPADWVAHLHDIDVVLNCVGILRPVGRASYERIHHLAPAALAHACADRRLRLIHVSALGLDAPVHSGFLRSKRAGEQALMASAADWYLVRPSLLDGDAGFGSEWIRRVARWPLHMVPSDAAGMLAPLDARDLGEALARLCMAPLPVVGSDPGSRIYELGGLHPCTMTQHLAAIRTRQRAAPARAVRIPAWIARVASHACDLLHVTPFSFGHLELLRRDNVPAPNRIVELLGRSPRTVAPMLQATGSAANSCTHELPRVKARRAR